MNKLFRGLCTAVVLLFSQQAAQAQCEITMTRVDVKCYGQNTGSLTANASGFAGPLTYTWSNDTTTTATNDSLTAGYYSVTVTDNIGCTVTAEANVFEGDPIGVFTTSIRPANPGYSNGAFSIVADGGTPDFTFNWDIPGGIHTGTTSSFDFVPGGTYNVTVTDLVGCTATSQVTVSEIPPSPLGASITPTHVSCSGLSNGAAEVTVFGGIYPYSYVWSGGYPPTSSIGSLVTGTYTVTVYDDASNMTVASVIITSPSGINPFISKTDATCGASDGSCSASVSGGTGPYTYLWSNAGETTAVITGLMPGTYRVTITDTKGCFAIGSASLIYVGGLVGTSVKPTDTLVCSLAPVTLRVTGGSSYAWSPAMTLDNSTSGTPVARPSVTTTYTVTITGVAGCSTIQKAVVRIKPGFTLSTSGDKQICRGGYTFLSALGTGASSYAWSPALGLNSTTIANPRANPDFDLDYTVVVTGNNGCTASAVVKVTVQDNPTPDAGVDVSICQGEQTNLNANGGIQYLWSPSNGLSSVNLKDPVAKPQTTTTYMVVVTNTNGCTASDEMVVNVNPFPIAVSPLQGTICQRERYPITLTASGASTYTWTPSNGLNTTDGDTVVATPSTSTTYQVHAVAKNGCARTLFVPVLYRSNPIANAGLDRTICFGNNVTLNGVGGSTYKWIEGQNISNTTIANPIVTPTSSSTYTLVTYNEAMCSDTDFVVVNVKPLPVLVFDPFDDSICPDESTVITINGAETYKWIPSHGLSSNTSSIVTASPSITTTYTVLGTLDGCVSETKARVIVFPTPVINGGPDKEVCKGLSVLLSASGGVTYEWSPAEGLSNITGDTVRSTPTETITYTLVGYDTQGCRGTDQIRVLLKPLPDLLTNFKEQEICKGQGTAVFNVSGANTYSWSPSSGLNTNKGNSVKASPTANTTYTVTGVSGVGCQSSTTVSVKVNNPPTKPSITRNGNILTCSNATEYQWYLDNIIATGSIQKNLEITQSGTYKVVITDAKGCTTVSDDFVATVAGINSITNTRQFDIVPNPNSGDFVITLKGFTTQSNQIQLFNSLGSLVLDKTIDGSKLAISVPHLEKGVYLVRLTTSKGETLNRRVIITK